MQHYDSLIGISFEISSVGLSLDQKVSNIIDYRNSAYVNLIEEQSKPKVCPHLVALYNKEISASESILQSLVK